MLANKFIDLLESEKLLDPEMIEELRRQVAQSGNRLPIETLAKLLVENEQLTKFQAARLVSQVKEQRSAPKVDPVNPVEDDLTIAEPEDVKPKAKKDSSVADAPVAIIVGDDDVETVEIIDEDDDAVVVAEVIESEDSGAAAAGADVPQLRRPVRSSSRSTVAPPSRWETMRTYGAFGAFLAVLVAFGFLVTWFMQGSAEDALAAAKASYEAQDYAKAIKRYEQFAEGFPTHKDTSFARSRIAVAKIREATEKSNDVFEATKVAKSILPSVMDESQLSQVRGDLAGALINIGDKYIYKAESAKTNEERKSLVEGLRDQMELIQNPQYIASQERKQNEPKINSLEESRQRLLRDIQRSEDRQKAAGEMQAALEAKDAATAYGVRQTLVRRYPQLQGDAELSTLLSNATQLVQERVTEAKDRPELTDVESPVSIGKRVLLTNNTGKPLGLREEQMLFVKAKSSIYGIQASDGKVVWRQFIGSRDLIEPLSVSDNAVESGSAADCILAMPSAGILRRMAASSGETKWNLSFKQKIYQPQPDRNLLFVTDASGRVTCVDSESGQTRWCKQLPQSLSCGVSSGTEKKSIFVPGDSSNLYTISRRDGSCSHVFYTGHEPGTMVVPPLALLNRLLLFENIGPGYSQIRILALNAEETEVTASQDSIRLRGHILVPPQVEGRRAVVVTDLGEISVFEIETVNGEQRLVKMAGLVASETNSKISWPLLVGNDLWVAANQLTKYQVQAARQEIIREWVRDDEDQFLSRPIAVENFVIHTRNVRGTEGVRVTAINNKEGDPVWEANLGAPVVGIMQKGSAFHAITSQAALYSIEASNIGSGQIDGPIANPGRNQRQMSFNKVAKSKNGSLVAVNSERGNQVAYYSNQLANDRALTIISSATGDGRPSAAPLWLEDGIVIPMENGQLVAIDPKTGQAIGAPIQPPMEPGTSISWATPTLLDDQRTLVAANSTKQLFRIATGKQFSSLNNVPMANAVVGRLAATNNQVLVPTQGDQSSYVEIYDGTDLTRENVVAIEGRIVWGIHNVNELGIFYSNIEGLVAINSAGERVWAAALQDIAPVGVPQVVNEEMIVATREGNLYRFNLQNGKVTGVLRTGETVSSEPFVAGNGLLVPGDEGNVLAVGMDQFKPYEPQGGGNSSSGSGAN